MNFTAVWLQKRSHPKILEVAHAQDGKLEIVLKCMQYKAGNTRSLETVQLENTPEESCFASSSCCKLKIYSVALPFPLALPVYMRQFCQRVSPENTSANESHCFSKESASEGEEVGKKNLTFNRKTKQRQEDLCQIWRNHQELVLISRQQMGY